MGKIKIIAFIVLAFIIYKVFVAVKNFEVGLDKQVAEVEKMGFEEEDEVIGLMMNKVMNINKNANESARYLGKAMQFINFIRDIDEDLDLKRTYFPKEDLDAFELTGLTRGEARRKPEQFKSFVRSQIKLYFKWQKQAEIGFKFIPKNMRIAVKTASDMYLWTAKEIYKNPFIVYDMKIKPSWTKVLLNGLKNAINAYNPLGKTDSSKSFAKKNAAL